MDDGEVTLITNEEIEKEEEDLEKNDEKEEKLDDLKPDFSQLGGALGKKSGEVETRKVPVPPHRMTPLKNQWMDIYKPVVEHMKLQIRMNQKSKSVQIRTSKFTTDAGAIQKAEDFLRAFMMGFAVEDAIALLRIDDLFIDSFDITDVKRLSGANLSRAIGRISGKDGKTKFAIENSTRTRIVVADTKVHLLGSFANIKVARDAICDLIMGSPASKVYTRLRTSSSRSVERF
uniref:K Homology domain-containing protein n=1 Tax=Paramoeba aestuarina TaxID=180227 RepID=A0A7S4KUX2_9EUKA|eukprot:CAMPEP_0201524218 /NCGR_PEP_ID=MMETSP0161_2-20130828/21181_1 /ASSEMBLY_ACC=CAM_ASM_000251 /TAXON_ID=180227 /ORGANISM="Neoparamoeba aestuarina, Strain SoJaBio B1-5/56/2" /LENGTH=231 /DNA_ID=CAMNT_0047923511 /DNA_START=76 /DNA_END=771 /DNA_ORIENTATION=+